MFHDSVNTVNYLPTGFTTHIIEIIYLVADIVKGVLASYWRNTDKASVIVHGQACLAWGGIVRTNPCVTQLRRGVGHDCIVRNHKIVAQCAANQLRQEVEVNSCKRHTDCLTDSLCTVVSLLAARPKELVRTSIVNKAEGGTLSDWRHDGLTEIAQHTAA